VIALAAQMHVLKQLAYVTGGERARLRVHTHSGTSNVVLDEKHYRDLLFAFTLPPPAKVSALLAVYARTLLTV
jgi:hypothetical protein